MTRNSTSDSPPDRTLVGAIFEGVRAKASYVADLIERLVASLKGAVLGSLLGIGCQSAQTAPLAVPPPSSGAVVPADAGPPEDAHAPIGPFNITFYYVIGEDEVTSPKLKLPMVVANDNQAESDDELDQETLAAISVPEQVTLYGAHCKPIADVSKEFALQLAIQGTGKLRDGRVVNVWGACSCERSPCFKVTENQWGNSGTGRSLQPFRTVAVDPKVVKLGTLLYVPLLEGRLMPGRAPWGGFIHDGCVVADDVGGGIGGNQLDLFVGRKAYFLGISGSEGMHSWARHVPVYDGTGICERKGRQIGRKAGGV